MSKVKNDKGYFLDVPVVDMKHFVLLLLAGLACKSPYEFSTKTIAVLPANYKEIIQTIMYGENGLGIRFSQLIDIDAYYEHQLAWEKKLGNMIQQVVADLGKTFGYNFENDSIEIPFTSEEIVSIKRQYDINALNNMELFTSYFTDLSKDYIFKGRNSQLQDKERKRERIRKKDAYSRFLTNQLKGIKTEIPYDLNIDN